jgi:hypothetical protein
VWEQGRREDGGFGRSRKRREASDVSRGREVGVEGGGRLGRGWGIGDDARMMGLDGGMDMIVGLRERASLRKRTAGFD